MQYIPSKSHVLHEDATFFQVVLDGDGDTLCNIFHIKI